MVWDESRLPHRPTKGRSPGAFVEHPRKTVIAHGEKLHEVDEDVLGKLENTSAEVRDLLLGPGCVPFMCHNRGQITTHIERTRLAGGPRVWRLASSQGNKVFLGNDVSGGAVGSSERVGPRLPSGYTSSPAPAALRVNPTHPSPRPIHAYASLPGSGPRATLARYLPGGSLHFLCLGAEAHVG